MGVEDSITLSDLELPEVAEDIAAPEIDSAKVISLDLPKEEKIQEPVIQKVAAEKSVRDVTEEDEHDRRHLGRVKSGQIC